jgi:hypothetical protein
MQKNGGILTVTMEGGKKGKKYSKGPNARGYNNQQDSTLKGSNTGSGDVSMDTQWVGGARRPESRQSLPSTIDHTSIQVSTRHPL